MREPILCFIIPGLPPSVNHSHRADFRHPGRRVRSPELEAWFDDCRIAAAGMRIETPLEGRLWLEAALWLADRRTDLDNYGKGLLDGLQRAGVVHNDRQIRDLRIYEAGIDREAPRVEVRLGRMTP